MKLRFHFTALAACFALCVSAAAAPVAQGPAAPTSNPQNTQPSISVHDLQGYIKQHAPFILLDVREPAEYKLGHIPGAILMPVGDITDGYARYPKEEMIVTYCKSGMRSEVAAAYFRSHGYQRVFILAGGYNAWIGAQQSGT